MNPDIDLERIIFTTFVFVYEITNRATRVYKYQLVLNSRWVIIQINIYSKIFFVFVFFINY